MLFWIVCLFLTLAVAAIVTMPLMRPVAASVDNPDIAIYRAQLAEIDRDLARDLLAPDEAERARTEIARRLLAADKAREVTTASGKSQWTTSLVTVAVLVIAIGTYWQLGAPGYGDLPLQARLDASDAMRDSRPDQATLEAATPARPPVEAPEDYVNAVTQLRAIAPTRPEDLEAWRLLAMHEMELQNFGAAARAQAQVIEIKGDTATTDDLRRQLDLMVAATNGLVSPEAEDAARRILAVDPEDMAALYYLGSLFDQTDRPDLAFRLWRSMVENGDPAVYYVASARSRIEDAAFRAGLTYALPETRGPSFADMDAAAEMSPEEQQEMIGGMVAGLADRLATQGGPAEDWARLIRAYGVLGDRDAAQTIWAEAQQVFVGSMRGMEILTNAAQDAGVLE